MKNDLMPQNGQDQKGSKIRSVRNQYTSKAQQSLEQKKLDYPREYGIHEAI